MLHHGYENFKKERFSRNTPSEIILFNLELIIKFNPSRYNV